MKFHLSAFFVSMFYGHLLKIQKMMAENENQITMEFPWEKYSSVQLPPHITSLHTEAFQPIVISFGPYHYNESHLKPMEAYKHRSFNPFLISSKTTREDLLQSFLPMKQELMDHCEQLANEWRDGDCFSELIIRGGHFTLDILHNSTRHYHEYDINEPVFGHSAQGNAMCQNIRRDMMLVENQLPLLVLEKLIAIN